MKQCRADLHERDACRAAGVDTCRIRPLGIGVAVQCTPALMPAVKRQLSPWIDDQDIEPADLSVRITGPSADTAANPYVLRDDKQVLMTADSADDVISGLQGWLDAEVTRRATHFTALHAGVVACDDRAILLPGPSGAGKSMLVAALLERGARYYSDELALLDARGWVHPYPRLLAIRDDEGRARATPPEEFGARRGTAALPVSFIVDLRFTAPATFRLDRLAASEAVLLLLANTSHRLSAADAVPTALVNAASGAISYQGSRGDAREAAEAILRLASSQFS